MRRRPKLPLSEGALTEETEKSQELWPHIPTGLSRKGGIRSQNVFRRGKKRSMQHVILQNTESTIDVDRQHCRLGTRSLIDETAAIFGQRRNRGYRVTLYRGTL